jgi:hypothetical protein
MHDFRSLEDKLYFVTGYNVVIRKTRLLVFSLLLIFLTIILYFLKISVGIVHRILKTVFRLTLLFISNPLRSYR